MGHSILFILIIFIKIKAVPLLKLHFKRCSLSYYAFQLQECSLFILIFKILHYNHQYTPQYSKHEDLYEK